MTTNAEITAEKTTSKTILGYPRIGVNRELKKLEESFWSGKISLDELKSGASELRLQTYARLAELGLAKTATGETAPEIPGTFSFYDQTFDAAFAINAIPSRFADLDNSLESYFTIARGVGDKLPLEMTKWLNTNYHYLVPEISSKTEFKVNSAKYVAEFVEAKEAGFEIRPVIVGPVTLLAFAKGDETEPDFKPFDKIVEVAQAYGQILEELRAVGCNWVQIEEPVFVTEQHGLTPEQIEAYAKIAYTTITLAGGPKILLSTPYGSADKFIDFLAGADFFHALHFDLYSDFERSKKVVRADFQGKDVFAGVINGRNVWRADLVDASAKLELLKANSTIGNVIVCTSTSLQHVPHTLSIETALNKNNPALVSNLSFAEEKVGEVIALATSNLDARPAADELPRQNSDVAARIASLKPEDFDREPEAERKAAQKATLDLPALPTTTIGSFPQTLEIRKARAAHNKGELTDAQYDEAMQNEIANCVKLQEELGLDVLVHGEAERNDMVQYFAENFDGCDVTANGWVQSYGSRCTRPSLIWGDVSRPAAFTVRWIKFAQEQTKKWMKGMLTGPVTILAWSFVRDDQPLGTTANQVALALADEIKDLEEAGIKIIQVDEPALRELLPLRDADHEPYFDWSINSFRLATSGVAVDTQIHTHFCYSEFGIIVSALDKLNADVASIEATRSKMDIVEPLAAHGYSRGIGPGVYDIHSPRVPSIDEVKGLIEIAAKSIDAENLWINPDCGLKTRKSEECNPALANMVAARNLVLAAL